MPWVKLSDDWYDDQQLIEVGPHATLLWIVGLSWSARNLTDGVLPRAQIRRLVDWTGCAEVAGMHGDDVTADVLAARLVDVGLWKPDEWGGFVIDNYLKYQPSRESVLASRERERQRWHDRKQKDSGDTPAGVGSDSGPPPTDPVPGPVPTSPSSSQDHSQRAAPTDDDFDWSLVWRLIAEHKRDQRDGKPSAAWVRTTARNQPDDEYEAGVTFAEKGRQLLAWLDIDERTLAEVLVGKRRCEHLPRRQP